MSLQSKSCKEAISPATIVGIRGMKRLSVLDLARLGHCNETGVGLALPRAAAAGASLLGSLLVALSTLRAVEVTS